MALLSFDTKARSIQRIFISSACVDTLFEYFKGNIDGSIEEVEETIYCIVLGVKISKCDEQNSREKAKKDLIGAIIGFVIIFVLILSLKIFVPILEEWVKTQM